MPRTDLVVASRPAFGEDGALVVPVNSDVTNGMQFTSASDVMLHARCVVSRSIRFTATFKGVTITKTVAMTAAQERVFGPFDADFWNQHGAVDGNKVYVDQVTGTAGDITLSAYTAAKR